MQCVEDDVVDEVDCEYEDELVNSFQQLFRQPARKRHRTRSHSYCDSPENAEVCSTEPGVVYQRRPRSYSEPSKGIKWKSHQHREQVHFPAPFSKKELQELSTIIAGDCDKMKNIDLDFIGLPGKACKSNKLEDLAEVAEDDDEMRDLRFNHFEKALEAGRLRLKSDRIWRYKKHRKEFSSDPVDDWLRSSYNNNLGYLPNAC